VRDAMRGDHRLGIGAMVLSWLLLAGGRKNLATFAGPWVPTILIVGLYNKMVKVEGSGM
jgi:hypothetical protein